MRPRMRCSMHHRIESCALFGAPPGTPGYIFSALAGVPIRAAIARPYCSFGVPVHHVGPVTKQAFTAFTSWAEDLQRLSARPVEAIALCSVWRPHKPGKPSQHPRGLAMDVGGIWWAEDDGVTAADYGSRRKEAVAIEATMRLHFGTVLGPTANAAHADHWHCDVGREPEITEAELAQSASGTRKVEVVWLQEAATVVHGRWLEPDGIWGPRTSEAVTAIGHGLDSDEDRPITCPVVYQAFCLATALVGFGQLERVGVWK